MRRILPIAALFCCPLATEATASAPAVPTFQTQWGGFGTFPGQFRTPNGITVDTKGNVYVVDQVNQRIQKFDRYGNWITQWGSYGFGNGQFANPSGIVADAAGNVYVGDGGNYRIQKFTGDGAYLTQWGSFGSGNGQFSAWSAHLAIDAGGYLYVTDNNRIQKFTNSGVYVTKWGSSGTGNGQFNGVIGIAVDGSGNVYAVDRFNTRIQKFTSTGIYLTQWGVPGGGPGQFGDLYDVAVDATGVVYVVDNYQRIQKFSSSGAYLVAWGSGGTGAGQLADARSMFVDAEGNVYVADTGNHRVQKFSGAGVPIGEPAPAFLFAFGTGTQGRGAATDAFGHLFVSDDSHVIKKFTQAGSFITQWGGYGVGPGQFDRPTGVATDAAGNVYVADFGLRVQKFTGDGGWIRGWPFAPGVPFPVAVDGAGYMYVGDLATGWIVRYSPTGAALGGWLMQGDTPLPRPVGIAVDPAGYVYVVDQSHNCVQKFTNAGTYVTQWGSFGTGNGQFDQPLGIGCDQQGYIYVSESTGNRVQKFLGDGRYVSQFGSSGTGNGQFSPAQGLTLDPAGNLYVLDWGGERVEKFTAPPSIVMCSDVGNDQGRQLRLRILRASADVAGSGTAVTGYAVYRRIDPLLAASRAREASTLSATAPNRVLLEGWDYVTTIPARGDAEYNVVVPTLADATESNVIYSAFMVSALTASSTIYFDSAVEYGYSIDNLPPPTPTPFTATYTSGATSLHWGVNTAADFATFRLHRGASADFVPGPDNLVVATADTGYSDVGAPGGYYKLAAVDLNGNLSPFAAVGPQQTVSAPAHDAPLTFALEPPSPNPAHGRDLTVRFTLPVGTEARIELFDVSGRRVMEREVGGLGPGAHTISLGRELRLAAGVYHLRLTQGTDGAVRRMAVVE